MTLPPFPYILNIDIYNEAGEKIRTLISTRASDILRSATLLENENEIEMITTDKQLKIKLEGIETPDTINQGQSIFIWNLKNDSGQFVKNGVYYIKISEKDSYGHTDLIIKSINVLDVIDFVTVNIYNSAGELVKTIRNPIQNLPNKLNISINDLISVEKNKNEILLYYGDNAENYVIWDGLTEQGLLVTSGIYEIQVVSKLQSGEIKVASKTVQILREDEEFLKQLKVYPNPFIKDKITFEWEAAGSGELAIRIYNLKGELVKYLITRLENGKIIWDLKTVTGALVSEGNYYVIAEAKNNSGILNRKCIKFSIVFKSK